MATGSGALCTGDVEFTDPGLGTVHGRPAVADWVRACARAFPDYRFEDPEPPYAASDQPKAIVPVEDRIRDDKHTGLARFPFKAFAAARLLLAGQATATPKRTDGIVEWIRLLRVASLLAPPSGQNAVLEGSARGAPNQDGVAADPVALAPDAQVAQHVDDFLAAQLSPRTRETYAVDITAYVSLNYYLT